jgi:hypothetical protein
MQEILLVRHDTTLNFTSLLHSGGQRVDLSRGISDIVSVRVRAGCPACRSVSRVGGFIIEGNKPRASRTWRRAMVFYIGGEAVYQSAPYGNHLLVPAHERGEGCLWKCDENDHTNLLGACVGTFHAACEGIARGGLSRKRVVTHHNDASQGRDERCSINRDEEDRLKSSLGALTLVLKDSQMI